MKLEQAAFPSPGGLRLVQRLPANDGGRDFVVGDLHGCRAELERLLRLVDFDPTRDRLLSVGDLVDRGPDSIGCLKLLEAPWFHAVMGNHEQLLLNYFAPWLAYGASPDPYGDAGLGFLINGGKWVLQEVDGQQRPRPPLRALLERVSALPQVLVVGEGRRRYHVVHAELAKPDGGRGEPGVWTDRELDTLPAYAQDGRDYPAFRWSRRFLGPWQPGTGGPALAPGLSETYCGHTVGSAVRRIYSHVCLDTGAFLAGPGDPAGHYGLTLLEVGERRYWTLRGHRLEEGEL
ncbi:metallophosphoesterase [Candidatus Methylocalor cossyra]|uniref:Serine/threonine protein phosphatase 1 n=1 Tax=Candidatus Methylocalor cossyra TaxID=3108543 RepID=A0ABM9NJK3_9GAMM